MTEMAGAPEYEDILYRQTGAVATVTINRPSRLNALRALTVDELTTAFERAASDPSVGVIVLTAVGDRAFCTGGDLAWEGSMEPRDVPPEMRRLLNLSNAMRNNGKPIIAAIRGFCLGGGNQLNMLCDLSIAAEGARFGDGAAKVGSLSFWWGMQLLPRLVGDKRAREIMYLSRLYNADEARQMGWVNCVVPNEQLERTVGEWCEEILERSPQALQFIKLALNQASDEQYGGVVNGGFVTSLLHGTDEFREGVRAMREKRKPEFDRWRRRVPAQSGEEST